MVEKPADHKMTNHAFLASIMKTAFKNNDAAPNIIADNIVKSGYANFPSLAESFASVVATCYAKMPLVAVELSKWNESLANDTSDTARKELQKFIEHIGRDEFVNAIGHFSDVPLKAMRFFSEFLASRAFEASIGSMPNSEKIFDETMRAFSGGFVRRFTHSLKDGELFAPVVELYGRAAEEENGYDVVLRISNILAGMAGIDELIMLISKNKEEVCTAISKDLRAAQKERDAQQRKLIR